MRKFLLASAALAALLAAGPSAKAANGLSIGTGFNFGHVQTNVGAVTQGTAAAGSLATGTNTSLGAGIATTTPAGSLTSAVGASAGQSNSLSGAFSIGNGAAATGGVSNNIGAGFGLGLTNTQP